MPGQDGPDALRLSTLPRNAPRHFALAPSAAQTAQLASQLGLLGLRKLRFEGDLHPESGKDWRLEAKLGATVVQPCVATSAPVTTRIDVPVLRRYTKSYVPPEDGEAEMPDDDTVDPLPVLLDLWEVCAEALALELPDYPRAPDATPADIVATPPGAAPLRDTDTKPFASLQGLREKLAEAHPDTPSDSDRPPPNSDDTHG